MKNWLFTPNEEGISMFDAIVGSTTILLAFIIMIVLTHVLGPC